MNRDEILSAIKENNLKKTDLLYLVDGVCMLLMNPDSSVSEKTRIFLRSRCELGGVNQQSVACYLHMSTRTLSRKLQKENTRFHELLDAERQRRCFSHIRQGVDCGNTLTMLLGLSDISHFYKLFKHWSGMGFADYKLKMAQKD